MRIALAGLATVALGVAGFVLVPLATADTAGTPDAAFKAWNDAFLARSGAGEPYYADTLTAKSSSPAKGSVAASNIAVAQDAYQRTRSPQHRKLVNDLVAFFLKDNGRDWTSNRRNDDLALMTVATVRGYQTSGNADWLTIAAANWNKAHRRSSNQVGGGGIWTDSARADRGKCALANNLMVTAGISLYQLTGDRAYLTKSTAMYDWVRRTLVNTATGQVNGCVLFVRGTRGPGKVTSSDNADDAGSWIEAANLLYRVTGNGRYYGDALRSANHVRSTVPVVHRNLGRGTSYQYRFFRGLSEFCTDNNLCGQYADYMRANANAAWSIRNGDDLMWNDWTKPTTSTNPDALEMAGAVGLWQQLPRSGASSLTGEFQLRNAASNQYLTVRSGSTANAAAVVQTVDAAHPSSLWTFVQRSNGHYEIRNVHSGQLLNVQAASARPGSPVLQWPNQGSTRIANDQWLPVHNADGTYSFYNRNSQLALDNPGGSRTADTQYAQSAPDEGARQKFTLVRRSTPGTPSASAPTAGTPTATPTRAPTATPTPGPTGAPQVPTTAAAKSIATLMKTYKPGSGRIADGWWTGAVSLSTVMAYRQATGDAQYDYAIEGAFAKNKDFTNEYIDDTGWWALVWIEAYDITGKKAYLTMAETATRYMHDYWDSTCGGGVYWSTEKKYKASIANELFLAAAAGLHNRIPGDTTYLGWAKAEWNWFKGTGLMSSDVVKDGLNVGGCGMNGWTFTYNQGVVLKGLIELSKATGDTSLLATADAIATAATRKFAKGGVLHEGCEPKCSGDGQAFKGIFIRYLREFAGAARTTKYDAFMTATANSILAKNTNNAGEHGNSFVGPVALHSATSQASAAAALVAALGNR